MIEFAPPRQLRRYAPWELLSKSKRSAISVTSSDNEIPEWFWELLDASRPSLQLLVDALEARPKEDLVAFARAFEEAAEEVCDYWDGPVVDDVPFSEDGTEDLCKWVVSQGRELWQQAVSKTIPLDDLVRLYWASGDSRDVAHPRWETTVNKAAYDGWRSPAAIVYAIFATRFGEDLLLEGAGA